MWTKLGDEFSDEARDLSDAAFRTHVEALLWSNRRGLDLQIPKRDLRRFAETDDSDTAAKYLIANDWWRDDGDSWYIGLRFPDWQQEKVVVDRRREQSALTTRRSRLHKAGDHSICLAQHCPAKRGDTSHDESQEQSADLSPGTGRDGAVRGKGRSPSTPVVAAPKDSRREHTDAPRCPVHTSYPAHNCGGCRFEALGPDEEIA